MIVPKVGPSFPAADIIIMPESMISLIFAVNYSSEKSGLPIEKLIKSRLLAFAYSKASKIQEVLDYYY